MQDIRVLIGSRIRALRKEAGLSQEALGLKADLDRTYIASVEGGKRNISIVNIEKVSHALGHSLTDFFSAPSFGDVEKGQAKVAEND